MEREVSFLFIYLLYGLNVGFREGFRRYDASLSSAEMASKIEKEAVDPCGDDHEILSDKIAKIKSEFDEAKQRFINIPTALKETPKLDPKGLTL